MAGRDAIPDLLEDWRRYERSLLQKLANRDRELLELHADYMRLEADYNVIVRLWRAMQLERIHRKRAANE